MFKYPLSLFAALLILTACRAPLVMDEAMFDGDCAEYPRLNAKSYSLPHKVTLYEYHSSQQIWLCYTLPEGSFGMSEIEISAPSLPEPYILHISAQLGEWPAEKPELAPQTPDSDKWWDTEGWFANAAYFNGFEDYEGKREAKFKTAKSREIVLKKSRFGYGRWSLKLDIKGIKAENDKFGSFLYPADESYLEINVSEAQN